VALHGAKRANTRSLTTEFEMKDLTPRLIEEAESKKLGITQGWYGTRVSGTFMTGACASLDECLEAIRLLPDVADNLGVTPPGDRIGAKSSATSRYPLYSQASAGRVGYKPSRQGNRQ
jgi:hypothetical protein